MHRHPRDLGQIHLDRPVHDPLVEQRIRSLPGRLAVLERELPEPSLHELRPDPSVAVGALSHGPESIRDRMGTAPQSTYHAFCSLLVSSADQ